MPSQITNSGAMMTAGLRSRASHRLEEISNQWNQCGGKTTEHPDRQPNHEPDQRGSKGRFQMAENCSFGKQGKDHP